MFPVSPTIHVARECREGIPRVLSTVGVTTSREICAVRGEGNRHDRYAMAVYRDEVPCVIVGHLPREIAKTC